MRTFAVAVASALLFVPQIAADGGFWSSCQHDWSMSNNVMQATCALPDGSTRFTTLDMNQCLTNVDGNLVARDGGGFFGSCFNCQQNQITATDPQTGFLVCSCKDDAGNTQFPTIDLDFVVGNNFGVLGCFGHNGS